MDNQMKRPSTTASSRTTPLTNRTSNNDNSKNKNSGVSSTGLIRLTLKKPMGIVFEPMEDPHNPSQQRGVRICDLPRTGAAALSRKLEIGDELLSINNKTMSRLTFDEIMDFIIEADADSVDLLFRRPKKDVNKVNGVNDSSKKEIKWAQADNVVTEVIEPEVDEATYEEETVETIDDLPPKKHHGGKKGREQSRRSHRDEESIQSADDTFYTETTDYTEETRHRKRRSRRSRRLESESFLDMLIDSLCAPVIGDGRRGDYDSDDDTYADDATYDTYDDDESYINAKKKKWNARKRREKEMLEKAKREKKKKDQMKKRHSDEDSSKENKLASQPESMSGYASQSKSTSYSFEPVQYLQGTQRDDERILSYNDQTSSPPPPSSNVNHMSPLNNDNSNLNMQNDAYLQNNINKDLQPTNHFQPNLGPTKTNAEESITIDSNIPITELEYDDQIDHAADVSVMDSIGGPSLLLENLRNASKIVKTVSTEIIQKFGGNYPQELGLTREESIQVDPMKFYRWIVKNLLEVHEPEKLRLIDKLFDKYKGREEHLIHKLNARYSDEVEEVSKKLGDLQNPSGSNEEAEYDGFKAFGGDFSRSESKDSQSKNNFDLNGWPAPIGEDVEKEKANYNNNNDDKEGTYESNDEEHSDEYSHSDDYESVDGTSPEVIAKVSELLNYVYGKTSVPGQIDRVSTIMRAYEGRTSVLLELLETKALLKANADATRAEPIPDSLKENPGLLSRDDCTDANGQAILSATPNVTGSTNPSASNKIETPPRKPAYSSSGKDHESPIYSSPEDKPKKKKGFFGIFKKKKTKDSGGGAFPSSDGNLKAPRSNKKGALLG